MAWLPGCRKMSRTSPPAPLRLSASFKSVQEMVFRLCFHLPITSSISALFARDANHCFTVSIEPYFNREVS